MSRSIQRLLVGGAAGFIGSNFVRLLRQNRPQLEVWALDKLTYAGNPANLREFEGQQGYRFIRGDICDVRLVDAVAAQVDAIVNFAAETHVDRSLLDPVPFVQTDVLGTAVLCDAACRHGHQALLVVSTDEVYGHVPTGRSQEADVLLPRSPYAASKVGGEMLARSYRETFGLPLLITRGSNTYGPYQYPEKIVPLFITNAFQGLPLPVYGDGSAVRDYLYVEDHCRAIELVLFEAPGGCIYNVGTGTETSGNQIAHAVIQAVGGSTDLIRHVTDRPGHDYRYAIDSTRIQQLGWVPKVDLHEGLERTVQWYRENEVWWRPLKTGEFWSFYKRNYQLVESA